MTPLEFGLFGGYVVLEWWLGKTDRVKAGSAVEAILHGVKFLAQVLVKRKL